MPDFKNGFSIDIKYDGRTEKQNFSMAKGDDALCLYEQNSDNAVMMLEPQKREFTIDNSTHRFDAISKESIIILKNVSNIQIQYNTDFTITADTENGKRTFRISHHEVSVKIGTSFEPVATFNKPLDVTLPESLPAQISNGNIKMNSFPAQMTNMLVNDYNYQTLTLKNGLTVLKSPDGEIFYQDGTKLSTSSIADIVQAPSGLVLRFLPMTEMSKMEENRVRKGIRISEEDAIAFSEFVNQPLDLNGIPTLASDASYTRLTKSSPAYRIGKEEAETQTETQTEAQTETQTETQAEAETETETQAETETETETQAEAETQDQSINIGNYQYTTTPNDNNLTSEYFTVNTTPWDDIQYTPDLGINANRNPNEDSTENTTTTDETQKDDATEQPVNNTEESTENTENTEKNNPENPDGDSGDGNEGSTPTQTEQPKPETNPNNSGDTPGFTAGGGKPNEKGNIPTSPQNNNGKKDESNSNQEDENKKKDKDNEDKVNEKRSAAIQKGIRIVLFIAAANLFMAAFMLANPLLALLATMCVAGMATSLAVQSLLPAGTFSSMFTIGSDIKDWWKEKQHIKELTPRQKSQLAKLQQKVERGEQLSSREQKRLQRLSTRSKDGLSEAEYKEKLRKESIAENEMQALPSFHRLNDLRAQVENQNSAFEAQRESTLIKIEQEIAAREKVLEVGKDRIPAKNQELIKQDIESLKKYGNTLAKVDNPALKPNEDTLAATETQLREDYAARKKAGEKPNNWLEKEPMLDTHSTFEDALKKSELTPPSLHYSDEEIKRGMETLKERVAEKEASPTSTIDPKTIVPILPTKTDGGPTMEK